MRGDKVKGKKTDNETIYKVMLSMFSTGNFSETARQLDMPQSTVEKIYKDNKNEPEFVKLCEEKKEQFVETATNIINKATELLERRIEVALDNQDELDELIDEVWQIDKKDLNETRKKALVNKLTKMQLNNLSEITTAIGTLYDKRALARGESTTNTGITIKMDKKVEELAQ